MDSVLNVAGIVLGALGCALLLHVTLPAIIYRRALVWHGTEMMLATIALLGAFVPIWWPLAVALAIVTLAVALTAGPWMMWGVSADQAVALAKRASSMVRVRFEPDANEARRVRVGDAATLRARKLGPRITLLTLTGKRTPKVKLWRKVFRKQAENVDLRKH